MNLYFDNAATTKVCTQSTDAMVEVMRETFGNPSSLHREGLKSEQLILSAKKFFAAKLGVTEKEIFFTSGGTESNNLAILGTAKAYRRSGKHIVTTTIEHPSVGSTCYSLMGEGFEISSIKVDATGQIDINELIETIRDDTILVSIMMVNNEIGSIGRMVAIGKAVKKRKPDILFHVDGVQGFMKFDINLKEAKIDLFSASSHKIQGPKGCGLLYVKAKTKIKPLFFGGSQQQGVRPGTENVPGVVGFLAAAKQLNAHSEEDFYTVLRLKSYLFELIDNKLPHWSKNSGSDDDERQSTFWSPYIVNIRSKSIKGEVVLHALEDFGICISTGSACSSKKLNISHVLKGIGLKDEESDRSIRISLSAEHTTADIDYLVESLEKVDEMFNLFTKK